jgi:hypothetical protein
MVQIKVFIICSSLGTINKILAGNLELTNGKLLKILLLQIEDLPRQ